MKLSALNTILENLSVSLKSPAFLQPWPERSTGRRHGEAAFPQDSSCIHRARHCVISLSFLFYGGTRRHSRRQSQRQHRSSSRSPSRPAPLRRPGTAETLLGCPGDLRGQLPPPSCTRRRGDPGTWSCIETSLPPAAGCWKVRVSDANPVPRGSILQEQKLAAAAAFRCVQSTAKLRNIKCQQPSIAFFPPKTRSCSAHSVIQHLAREIYSLIITEMWLWKAKLLTLEISVLWWVLFGFFFIPFWLKLYYPIKTA